MKVALGRLAREGIEDLRGSDLGGGVEAALRYYVGGFSGGEPPLDLPPVRGDGLPGWDSTDVELSIDPSLRVALERDAERQAATLGELTTHAVLVYLAAWDRVEGD